MLKQGNCVKRFTAVSTDTLEARSGQSYLVRGLYAEPESGNTYLTLKVDRKTVGVYRIAGLAGNQLNYMHKDFVHNNLMEFLQRKGVNCSIPVAEGQTFTVTTPGTSPTVVIVYDTYDAGDIRADMPNGTASKEYMFVQYFGHSGVVDSTKDILIDGSLSPSEFPDFPCGKSVPANTTIDILGLVGSPTGAGTSELNKTYSTYVKLVKDRETLFDEDRNGIPFFFSSGVFGAASYWALMSLIGGCVSLDTSTYNATFGDPLMFAPPLTFRAGEELLVYVSFVQLATTTVAANKIDLAAIMNVKVV